MRLHSEHISHTKRAWKLPKFAFAFLDRHNHPQWGMSSLFSTLPPTQTKAMQRKHSFATPGPPTHKVMLRKVYWGVLMAAGSTACVDRPQQTGTGPVPWMLLAALIFFLLCFCSWLCSVSQTAHWFLNAALKSFSPSSFSLLQLALHCAAMRRHHHSICHFRAELHQSSADASACIRSEGTISSQKDPALCFVFFFLFCLPACNGSMQSIRNISSSLSADSRAGWK